MLQSQLPGRANGLATTAELLGVMTRKQLDAAVRRGRLIRVWHGVYSTVEPDLLTRLWALDLVVGGHVAACLHTAATLYGFGVHDSPTLHVLDPGNALRSTAGLVVHRREGAPLQLVSSRQATAPAWTAVEVARQLPRPRALATLDSALHTRRCTPAELSGAVDLQRGRRGIAHVREVLGLADGRAESAMESEARLAMIDHGLPLPELQHLITGRDGELWRVDFAWPEARVAAEYDSVQFHSGPAALVRDRKRIAGIQEMGWIVIPIVAADVRRDPARMCARIRRHLAAA